MADQSPGQQRNGAARVWLGKREGAHVGSTPRAHFRMRVHSCLSSPHPSIRPSLPRPPLSRLSDHQLLSLRCQSWKTRQTCFGPRSRSGTPGGQSVLGQVGTWPPSHPAGWLLRVLSPTRSSRCLYRHGDTCSGLTGLRTEVMVKAEPLCPQPIPRVFSVGGFKKNPIFHLLGSRNVLHFPA